LKKKYHSKICQKHSYMIIVWDIPQENAFKTISKSYLNM